MCSSRTICYRPNPMLVERFRRLSLTSQKTYHVRQLPRRPPGFSCSHLTGGRILFGRYPSHVFLEFPNLCDIWRISLFCIEKERFRLRRTGERSWSTYPACLVRMVRFRTSTTALTLLAATPRTRRTHVPTLQRKNRLQAGFPAGMQAAATMRFPLPARHGSPAHETHERDPCMRPIPTPMRSRARLRHRRTRTVSGVLANRARREAHTMTTSRSGRRPYRPAPLPNSDTAGKMSSGATNTISSSSRSVPPCPMVRQHAIGFRAPLPLRPAHHVAPSGKEARGSARPSRTDVAYGLMRVCAVSATSSSTSANGDKGVSWSPLR